MISEARPREAEDLRELKLAGGAAGTGTGLIYILVRLQSLDHAFHTRLVQVIRRL